VLYKSTFYLLTYLLTYLGTVSYSTSIATMAVSVAVLTQYTNVTDGQTQHDGTGRVVDDDECKKQSSTDLHFGLVMRVGELRVQDEAERRIVFDLLVADLDRTALLDRVAADDRIQHRVDGLLDVLDEHGLSHGHGALDHVQVVLMTETHDCQTTSVPRLRIHFSTS